MEIKKKSNFSLLSEIPDNDLLSSEVTKSKDVNKEEVASIKPAPKKFVIPSKRIEEKKVQFVDTVTYIEPSKHVKTSSENIEIASSIAINLDLEKLEITGKDKFSSGGNDETADVTGHQSQDDDESQDDDFSKPEPPHPKLTLKEWKAQQISDEPHFNVRKAGEGSTELNRMAKLSPIKKEDDVMPSPEVKKHSKKKANKEGKRKQNTKQVSVDFLYEDKHKVPVRPARYETGDVGENRSMGPARSTEVMSRDEGKVLEKLGTGDGNWRDRKEETRGKKQEEARPPTDIGEWRKYGHKQQENMAENSVATEKDPKNDEI